MFPSLTSLINAGILIETGQPSIHFAFLQLIHLVASSIASSLLYPKHTSSKFLARTSGSCSLTGTFFNTSAISCHLHNDHTHRDVYHLPVILALHVLLQFCTSAVFSLPDQSQLNVRQIQDRLHRQI